MEAELRHAASDQDRRVLEQRLNDIKKASIELHLEGRLEDSDGLHSLLVALADTRNQIRNAAT